MTGAPLEVHVHPGIAEIGATDWDACACPEATDGSRPEDPFTTYRFLHALEQSGSVGPGTGWQPRHLSVRSGGDVVAVAPLYGKSHSQGEYMFDHAFADAYERAGGRYYPKLQIAVPFTPVTGRRFLTLPGWEATGTAALLEGATRLAEQNGVSSLHATFCTGDEAERGEAMGLLPRIGQQYHWENRSYADFDGFLADLSSRKRKTIRKERQTARGFGGEIVALTGDDLRPEHWDALWTFYQNTGARKWGTPYLTRAFFDIAQQVLHRDTVIMLALRDGRAIAGALNFAGRHRLYGRYWGATEHHSCLHFELCYYRAIDWAIAHGLDTVEAGAQGEHKIARGYLPVPTHGLHWFPDAGFQEAVRQYLDAERTAVAEDIAVLTEFGPFRRANPEDHE